ncbi:MULTISPECIES: DUF2939 domain-containing protein [Methylobacterium]|uniref:DUF2939 domain-containing protein n=1 Tax=Methylobacterium longum TaxID=767694 RepID=A0ABT8AH16_9HYPH|nr:MULTISPECIES: DUF2939 domain-containing protein [Methylobacterium]MCJ2100873.1 DUF2939 domain-containing protein [Methylobacterium sp. E-046]MDN3569094.1 DUF2939 domain-containing protein [Methylobacterium longum]GJE10504.1 hypothetical protein FOHLNKBM_1539 [Methylobacterium longum]
MRWLAIPLALALAWLAFTLSPLWSLYDLAQAVRRHDAAYVESHVNFRTLRLSLVRQITAAMRVAAETDTDLEPRDRQRLNDAAYGLALALSETMVTPETVIDLLANGWPDKLDVERPAGARPEGLAIRNLGRLMPYYAALEMRGFRAVVIPIPPEAPRAERTRIRLRLRGLSWRLVDIEMADMLREQIAAKLGRALARAKIGASAGEER